MPLALKLPGNVHAEVFLVVIEPLVPACVIASPSDLPKSSILLTSTSTSIPIHRHAVLPWCTSNLCSNRHQSSYRKSPKSLLQLVDEDSLQISPNPFHHQPLQYTLLPQSSLLKWNINHLRLHRTGPVGHLVQDWKIGTTDHPQAHDTT